MPLGYIKVNFIILAGTAVLYATKAVLDLAENLEKKATELFYCFYGS